MDASQTPILVNVRDRVTDLRSLVAWLERAGHERIVLLDNASTYEPLLEYLRASPHEVRWLGQNLGSRALWRAEMVPDEHYVYTDPDVVPTDECPLDAVEHLRELLDRYPDRDKVGLGLTLEGVPESMPSLEWERGPIRGEDVGAAYVSLVDTTFALHRPGTDFRFEALRTKAPYEVRHMPWYATERTAEDHYYLSRALTGPFASSWAEQEAA